MNKIMLLNELIKGENKIDKNLYSSGPSGIIKTLEQL